LQQTSKQTHAEPSRLRFWIHERPVTSSCMAPAIRLPLRPAGRRERQRRDQTRVGDDAEAVLVNVVPREGIARA
jgi:hypothetical protein